MTGRVVVMEPAEYRAWLGGGQANEPPAVAGKRLFEELRCVDLPHAEQSGTVRCPPLENLYGQRGQTDDRTIRHGRRRLPSRVDPASRGQESSPVISR